MKFGDGGEDRTRLDVKAGDFNLSKPSQYHPCEFFTHTHRSRALQEIL